MLNENSVKNMMEREGIENIFHRVIGRIEMLEKSIKEYKESKDYENAMKCDIKRSSFQLIADDLRKELQK